MIELVRNHSDDFTVNLIAGLAIFVLDVLLIAIALPWLLGKWNRFEWRKVRREFGLKLLSGQRLLIDRLCSRAKSFTDARSSDYTDQHWQDSIYAPLFAKTVSELDEFIVLIEREAAVYAVSLGPDDHMAFVAWREAVCTFREALHNLAHTGWALILGGQPDRIGEAQFMAPVRTAFAGLSETTASFIETSGLPRTIQGNEGVVSVLPADRFDGFYWDGIQTALIAAASR